MRPKIAWPSVGVTEYSLIQEGFFLLDTNYFLTCSDLISLLAFLNSNLIKWWINSEDTQLGDGGAWRHYINIILENYVFIKIISFVIVISIEFSFQKII